MYESVQRSRSATSLWLDTAKERSFVEADTRELPFNQPMPENILVVVTK